MDPHIANLIATGQVMAVWTQAYASNTVNHLVYLQTFLLIVRINQSPILSSVLRRCFEVAKLWLEVLFLETSTDLFTDINHLAHVLAKYVLRQTRLDLTLSLWAL